MRRACRSRVRRRPGILLWQADPGRGDDGLVDRVSKPARVRPVNGSRSLSGSEYERSVESGADRLLEGFVNPDGLQSGTLVNAHRARLVAGIDPQSGLGEAAPPEFCQRMAKESSPDTPPTPCRDDPEVGHPTAWSVERAEQKANGISIRLG